MHSYDIATEVQVRTNSGITRMPLNSCLLSKRKIFLYDEINDITAGEVIKQLLYLNLEDPQAPIDLIINSNGGEIGAGFSIINAIHSSAAPVRMFNICHAYSMAALIFASGKCGRYMFKDAEVMLHQPLIGNMGGNAASIKSISDRLQEKKAQVNALLSESTGRSIEEVDAASSYDHYMTAQEAVSFGMCDGIRDMKALMEVTD